MRRWILHIDQNSFYASCEQAEYPELRGKALVVGGSEERRHGIVLAKSQEAKRYGIVTAETIREARIKCPDLIVRPANFRLYMKYSSLARQIYYDYTDLVEPFGPDEAWLDVTHSAYLNGGARHIAEEISERIRSELGLSVSIGVSWNKVFAKFGSDYKKPDAITWIDEGNYQQIVWESPVRDLLYIGPATERKLKILGIQTIGQLACEAPETLLKCFGKIGGILQSFARGLDDSPVKAYDPDSEDVSRVIKSYGNGLTAPHDICDPHDAKALIYMLSESVAQRLREGFVRAKTISIGVRDSELASYTRQLALSMPTNSTSLVAEAAWRLLRDNEPLDDAHPLRSMSVRASDLSPTSAPMQISLWGDERLIEKERLDSAIDDLRRRFGNNCIQRGIELYDGSLHELDIKRDHVLHPVAFFYD
ncbi:MAG: DNA polymerase IV [Coriobacteriia bacterium]|nr:DNA polymerase IV [Coriobacteriia bacterium]